MTEQDTVASLTPESAAAFWRAFAAQEGALSALSGKDFVDQANELLADFAPELALELEGDVESDRRTLVLSAHGRIEQFPNLMVLANAAPPLARHTVVSFRSRSGGESFGMRMNDFELSTDDVQAGLYNAQGLVGLELAFARDIPMDMQDHARHMTFIMLDHVLGEYDFAVRVGPVDFVDALSDDLAATQRLTNLAPAFDHFWRETMGRTGDFPGEDGPWALLEAEGDDGQPSMLVVVNQGADALATRADLCWAMELALPLHDASLDSVQEVQEAIGEFLEGRREGVLAHCRTAEGVRTALYYVADAQAAADGVKPFCRQQGLEPPEVQIQFDPAWRTYLDFYVGPSHDRHT